MARLTDGSLPLPSAEVLVVVELRPTLVFCLEEEGFLRLGHVYLVMLIEVNVKRSCTAFGRSQHEKGRVPIGTPGGPARWQLSVDFSPFETCQLSAGSVECRSEEHTSELQS